MPNSVIRPVTPCKLSDYFTSRPLKHSLSNYKNLDPRMIKQPRFGLGLGYAQEMLVIRALYEMELRFGLADVDLHSGWHCDMVDFYCIGGRLPSFLSSNNNK